jgi:hypothetical protein
MGITIGIIIDDKSIQQEECVLLDEEIIEYISHLKGFPMLKQLGNFDPYDDTLISLSMQMGLKRELTEIIELAKNKNLPKPPDYVGLEGGVDVEFGEEFGWVGLVAFFKKLKQIISNNKLLLAIGD